MLAVSRASVQNRLISLMSDEDFYLIARHLEPVELPFKHVLASADEVAGYVYFPNTGIGSIVTVSPEGQSAETGLFGRDGFSPTAQLSGAPRNLHLIFMQIEGEGFRIETATLRDLARGSESMRDLLTRYVHTLATQTTFTALSNAVHHIDERLARWLLMCHDRIDGNDLPLTHEFLSIMLAVRRPSVTTALHALEGNRLIVAVRGMITIRDRSALEAFAFDAYGKPEQEYREMIGAMR